MLMTACSLSSLSPIFLPCNQRGRDESEKNPNYQSDGRPPDNRSKNKANNNRNNYRYISPVFHFF
jgi:hypothetical protein